MKKLILVVAFAAACFTASAADAQSTVVLPQVKNAGGSNVPSQASVLTGADGLEKGTSSNPVYVTGGGGGGGSTITAPAGTSSTNAVPVQSVTGGALALDASVLALFKSGQLIGNTAFGISGLLPGFASTPTFNIGTAPTIAVTGTFWQGTQPVSGTINLGTGGAGTAGTPLYTTSSTPSVGAPGSAAPANAQQVGGLGPSGNLRALSVGTLGGLLPGQGAPTSTRTTLTASTATALEAAGVAGRVAESFFVEATLTAPVYICSTQTTSCSATAYDFLIPSGATAGTIYSPIFATTARLYAYSTGTPVVVLNSWIAQ